MLGNEAGFALVELVAKPISSQKGSMEPSLCQVMTKEFLKQPPRACA